MLNLTRVIDNIKVRVHGVKLYIHEIKNVSALESRIRTIYELEGIVEESDEAIKTMQAKITLACGNPEEIKRLMGFLKMDSHRVDFLQAYNEGKKSYLAGEEMEVGFTNYFRKLCMSLENIEFNKQFQDCFSKIVSLIQYEELREIVSLLVEEYRHMYCKVNDHIDEFFELGYEYMQLPPKKKRHIPSHIIPLEIDGEEYFIDLKKSSACGL